MSAAPSVLALQRVGSFGSTLAAGHFALTGTPVAYTVKFSAHPAGSPHDPALVWNVKSNVAGAPADTVGVAGEISVSVGFELTSAGTVGSATGMTLENVPLAA